MFVVLTIKVRSRRLCVSTALEGLPAVMSALAAAVHQASLQQTLLLETLDAVQVGDMHLLFLLLD